MLVAVARWCGTYTETLAKVKEAVKQSSNEVSVMIIGVWSGGL